MKRSVTSLGTLSLIVALVSIQFVPNFALAFDSTPPKVESCTISPRVVSDATGGTIRVTIKVQSISGLSSNVLSVLNLKNNNTGVTRQLGGFIMSRQSGDEFSSIWVQDIDVKPGLMPGIYELNIFPLTDKLQNGTSFIGCPGQDVTYGVATPTPSPTPSPTSSAKSTNTVGNSQALALSARVMELETINSNLESANLKLSNTNKSLANRLARICSAKPKPKGC